MELYRKKQKLNDDLDVITMEEYKECAKLWYDFRIEDISFCATCDFQTLKDIQIGEEIMLINEDTNNLSPYVFSIEIDDENIRRTTFEVTRKIYSPTGLDVYVIISNKTL